MSSMLHDLKLSLRQLWHKPAFTLTAVLTLGIGMGVNAVAFTVVNGVLFKRPSIATTEEAGRIETMPASGDSGYASVPEYRRFADATQTALELAAEGRATLALRHFGTTRPAYALFVSTNYFSLVPVTPLLGRVAVGRGVGGPPSAVIGESFWRRTLGEPPLSGLTLRLNDTTVHVTGVLPASFRGPGGLYAPDIWLPLDDLGTFRMSSTIQARSERWLFLFARMRPETGAPAVQGILDSAVAAMAREWPETHRDRGARFRLMSDVDGELTGLRTAATLAMSIIGLVLLLACFNVANLLLARAVERERDLAIRAAIGANPARLVRLVMIEGLMLAAMAGVTAWMLARWTQALVGTFAIPIDVPQHIDLSADWRVIGFISLLVLIAGVAPGLWPAFASARVDVAGVLGSQGAATSGRSLPIRRWLVGAQIAGSTAFLAIAMLLVQSHAALSEIDTGFAREELVVVELSPASHGYDVVGSQALVDTLVSRVGTLSGVSSVAVVDNAPFFIGFQRATPVSSSASPCAPAECPQYSTYAVSPGYFATMGTALTSGREFTRSGVPEIVINQSLARRLREGGGAVGETLAIGREQHIVTVVGVTGHARTRGLDREEPTMWVPLEPRHYSGSVSVVVRTSVPPATLTGSIREAAQSVDPNVALASVKTMEQRMAVQLWPSRTVSWLFLICGSLALVLATVGLAGVVIHGVNRRLKEFGVRVSMGATPGDLIADVLTGSARLLLPGLMLGVLLAAGAARLLQFAFIGVNVLDPATYLGVMALESLIVIAATIGPAVRAARVDPVYALRSP